jgi:hypothetical protein
MRLHALFFLVAVASQGAVDSFGFASQHASRSVAPVPATLLHSANDEQTPCSAPVDVASDDLVSQKGSGKLLRSARLTNVNGEKVSLGDHMGEDTSIVILLRHLG